MRIIPFYTKRQSGFKFRDKNGKELTCAQGIRAARKKLGLTQKDFAETLGKSLQAVQSWEYGRRKPSATVIMLLREYISGRISLSKNLTRIEKG